MKWLAASLMMLMACDGTESQGRSPDGATVDGAVLDAAGRDSLPADVAPTTPDAPGGRDEPVDQPVLDAGSEAPAGPRPAALTWVREAPNVRGDVIRGTAADDIWVVNKAGGIWHSRGDGTWQDRSDERNWQLTDVWGSGPNDVYVSVLANFVYHWNGTGWAKQTDGIPIGLTYRTIWGSGPTDIFMAGPSVYRSSGDGRWVGQTVPLTVGPFVDSWGSGPSDVWVLGGNGGVARWKGDGQWRAESGARERGAVGIWGSGPNDVYVLYFDAVVHTDGSGTWTVQSVPEKRGSAEQFVDVWGSGPTDVYIGGSDGRLFHSQGDGRWFAEMVDPQFPRLTIYGIWGSGPRDIYLVTIAGIYRGR